MTLWRTRILKHGVFLSCVIGSLYELKVLGLYNHLLRSVSYWLCCQLLRKDWRPVCDICPLPELQLSSTALAPTSWFISHIPYYQMALIFLYTSPVFLQLLAACLVISRFRLADGVLS